MSHRAFCWALTQQVTLSIPPAQFALLMRCAYYANADGADIYPSPETLATESGISVRRAQEHLRWLVEAGALALVRRGSKGRTTTRYAMPIPAAYVPGQPADRPARYAGSRVSEAARNARSRAPETRDLAPEPKTGTNNSKATTPDEASPSSAAVDPIKAEAKKITREWWESFAPQKPIGKYIGFEQIVERLLRDGSWASEAVAAAARDCGMTLTGARMQASLLKQRGRTVSYAAEPGTPAAAQINPAAW